MDAGVKLNLRLPLKRETNDDGIECIYDAAGKILCTEPMGRSDSGVWGLGDENVLDLFALAPELLEVCTLVARRFGIDDSDLTLSELIGEALTALTMGAAEPLVSAGHMATMLKVPQQAVLDVLQKAERMRPRDRLKGFLVYGPDAMEEVREALEEPDGRQGQAGGGVIDGYYDVG